MNPNKALWEKGDLVGNLRHGNAFVPIRVSALRCELSIGCPSVPDRT